MEKKNEADCAYAIIAEKGGPVFYRDLVEEIIERMNLYKDPKTMASIYTRINVDHRLNHIGEGYWVLREE